MQEKDDNVQIIGLMKIYKENLKEFADEMTDKRKKDPEIIIELDKQLKFIEKSITQLKKSSSKNLTKSKENIKKRTKENFDLIEELNQLRFTALQKQAADTQLDKDINQHNLMITRLQHEIEHL